MAQGSNPFYVQPMGDMTQGLQGLGQGLGSLAQAQQARAMQEQEQAKRKEMGRLFNAGSPQEIAAFALQNPEFGQQLKQGLNFRDEPIRNMYVNSFYAAKEDPSKIPTLINAYEARLKIDGYTEEEAQEIEGLRQGFATDPDKTLRAMEMDVAFLDTDKYNQYAKMTTEPEVDQTNDVQNFEYYAQLYETNPDMADKFAVQVGISPADNYESLMAELQMMKLRQEVTAGETEASDKVTAKEAGKKASIESKKSKSIELNRTISQIDEIVETVESSFAPTTGLMGMVSGAIPGTEAYGVRGDVEMIKGKLGLDMIKEMKQQSSTGATGFGAMSEKELALIQSAVDRLDPNMDRDRFLQAMAEIKGHYQLWKEYNDKALAEEARMASEGTANKSGIRSIGVLQGLQTSEMSDAELEAFIKANK